MTFGLMIPVIFAQPVWVYAQQERCRQNDPSWKKSYSSIVPSVTAVVYVLLYVIKVRFTREQVFSVMKTLMPFRFTFVKPPFKKWY
jgi:hypothetical protein